MILYHYWRSSCSWRVRWALELKKIAYKNIPIDMLKGEHQTPAFLAKNPLGFLPTLEVNGQFFGESMAILEWLEEQFPKPALLPASANDRLYVRQLSQSIVSGIQPLQNMSVLKYHHTDEAQRKETAAYWITRGLTKFEQVLNKNTSGTYCAGSEITFADLCLIPQCYNALRQGVDLQQFPRIAGIYKRSLATPECQKAAPENFQP